MKEGRKSKDADISDNFNTEKAITPSRKDVLAALAQKRKAAREAGITNRAEIAHYGEDPKEAKVPEEFDDLKSSERMLHDLRYGYKNSEGPDGKKGRDRLVELMKSDSEFKFAVKELMKLEVSLLSAKIRKTGEEDGRGVNQNFFVILKGLEDEKKFTEMIDKTVDMRQVSRAMNPDGSEMNDTTDTDPRVP